MRSRQPINACQRSRATCHPAISRLQGCRQALMASLVCSLEVIEGYVCNDSPPAQCPQMLGIGIHSPMPGDMFATSISESSGAVSGQQRSKQSDVMRTYGNTDQFSPEEREPLL